MVKLLALLAAAALLYHLLRSGALFRGHRGGRERQPRHRDKRDDRDVVDAEFRDLES